MWRVQLCSVLWSSFYRTIYVRKAASLASEGLGPRFPRAVIHVEGEEEHGHRFDQTEATLIAVSAYSSSEIRAIRV